VSATDVKQGSELVRGTLVRLAVDPDTGLSETDVAARRAHHGFNEVAEPKRHPLLRFLSKFWGLSAWMLELIMLLSAVLGKYSDLAVVSGLLVVNATIGYLNERRAAGVVESLRARLNVSARVRREAHWRLVPARELVPGDIVRLRPGDVVPADVTILAGTEGVDQSALTGESTLVNRAPGDLLWSGSIVRTGEATGVVSATGAATYYGRTTELVQEARPKPHIEDVVAKVVRWLFVIVGTLLALVTIISVARGSPFLEVIPLLLVLLMSAVPVALPVMFTVSMAAGARQLAARGVLVTRLSAAEDAATMDVLCVDKTGTITRNQLMVTGVIPLGAATQDDVVAAGALASEESDQDPIDLAFLAASKARTTAASAASVQRVSFVPFDAATRRTEAVIDMAGHRLRVVKGAVRTVAERCGLGPDAIANLEGQIRGPAAKGYRTLAVARGPDGGALEIIGLVTLNDPPRPDAKALIATLQDLGIRVAMLTGDAIAIAREVSTEVGLGEVRRVSDLKDPAGGVGSDVERLLEGVGGLAEVYPEDKYFVVKRLQAGGHVTGMTGDGVNDAPALRQAEVGIAVSSATDVARSAASVVLTKPGLTNIVTLVEQGRAIYQRVLTWIINKISRTVLKAAFVATAYVFTGKFVVSAFAMLLLVFMTDFAKVALATDRVRPSPRPETWNIGVYVLLAAVLGIAMVAEALALLWIGWTKFGLASDDDALHTFSFLTLLYLAVFSILSVRERRWFAATWPGRGLALALAADVLIGTVLGRMGLQGLGPLPWWQVGAIFAYAAVACLLVNDALKLVVLRRLTRVPIRWPVRPMPPS